MLLATDFMCEAIARTTAIHGLIWQDRPAELDVVPDGRGARISGAFTFPRSRQMMPTQALMVEARTSVNEDSPMALEISISVPMADGGFVFKGKLSYPHQVSAPMVDPAFTSEQRANALEMVQRVFQAARACCSSTPGSQMELPNIPHVDTLEIFSVFALSRMYRWGMVELKEGSEAISMLQRDAARQLVCGVGTASAEVYKWFKSRLILRSPHDVYLDAVLYDIEQSARRRLIGVMSDPPGKDPLKQLSLLRRAVAAHPALWASACVTSKPEFAFALGMDLEPCQVPLRAIESMLAGFPTLLNEQGQCAALPPVCEWLNAVPLLKDIYKVRRSVESR